MLRFLLALFAILPLVAAPALSAQSHGGAGGCVTMIVQGQHPVGHGATSAQHVHDGHEAPAPMKERGSPMPCCLAVCPGLRELAEARLLTATVTEPQSRFCDDTAVGLPVEPADPPPRTRS